MSQSRLKLERIDAFLREEPWVETEAGLGKLFAEAFQKSNQLNSHRERRIVRMALGVIVHMLKQQLSDSSLASVGLGRDDVLKVEQDISFVPTEEATVNLAKVLQVQETALLRLAGYRQVDEATITAANELIKLANTLENVQSKDQLPRIREALSIIS